jgi:hypothetical protein
VAPSRLHTWQSTGLCRMLSRLMKLNHLTSPIDLRSRESCPRLGIWKESLCRFRALASKSRGIVLLIARNNGVNSGKKGEITTGGCAKSARS